jgi:hypothetical protein
MAASAMNRKDRPRVVSSRPTPWRDLIGEGHAEADTPRLAIALPVRRSHVQEQIFLRLADCSFSSMAHEQGEGAFLQAIDRADQAIQSAREECHSVISVLLQTLHGAPDEVGHRFRARSECERPVVTRQEPEHRLEKCALRDPKVGRGDRHADAKLARPRILRRLHPIYPRIGCVHHRREHEDVYAGLARIQAGD